MKHIKTISFLTLLLIITLSAGLHAIKVNYCYRLLSDGSLSSNSQLIGADSDKQAKERCKTKYNKFAIYRVKGNTLNRITGEGITQKTPETINTAKPIEGSGMLGNLS